jgi:hypothetical protein
MALEIGELITKIVKEIAKNSVYTKMESTHADYERQLSKDACSKSNLNREMTPSPLAAIEALRNAIYIVQSV